MPLIESKVKGGTLLLGTAPGTEFAAQATTVTITPDHSQDDPVETLDGSKSTPVLETAWNLNVTAIQDFDDPEGFVNYCYDNSGETVDFVWTPNAAGVSYAGKIQVRAVETGGDVGALLSTEAEFPCIDKPTRTDAAGAAPASSKSSK